jgi:hypothetical protein
MKSLDYVIKGSNGEYVRWYFSLTSSVGFTDDKFKAKTFDSFQEASFQVMKLPEIFSPYTIERL